MLKYENRPDGMGNKKIYQKIWTLEKKLWPSAKIYMVHVLEQEKILESQPKKTHVPRYLSASRL